MSMSRSRAPSRSQSQVFLQEPSYTRSRSRGGSNPWLQYSDFFANKSFLIPDTIAFSRILPYFNSLPGYASRFEISLVELVGYEAYFVEQWISSRSSNTLIVTYTGDQSDRIIAYHVQALSKNLKLEPPPAIHAVSGNSHNDSPALPFDNWPPKFISYLIEQLESPFSVATETSLGYAFITNLAQLNPFLSLIDAKTGKIADDYILFVVNYNLKKLGCGSRSAATTDEPSKSMESKFKTAFKIHQKTPVNYAVIDLIMITQTFLHYYGLLDPIYCDGLFCEKTEFAIVEWWKMISDIPLAMHIIKIKPPTCHPNDSIQAIIGFTVLCRYLLELGGNNFSVPKDPLEVKRMKESFTKFQKHFKIETTATLNSETLHRLLDWGQNIKASQNLAKDLSKVKNLVKNTVIDITSGKNLQIIAQNATASPFYLHSSSNYDHGKMINCQNIEHVKHMSLGKQLNYLFYGTGKPVNLNEESLSNSEIKRIAASTTNNFIVNNVKKLKSQLSLQSLSNQKSTTNNFLDLKNISNVTLNIFDRDHEHVNSDSDEKDYEKHKGFSDAEIDDVINNSNDFYEESNINDKIKKKMKSILPSSYLSSDDELCNEVNGADPLSGYNNDNCTNEIAVYTPNKKYNRPKIVSSRTGSVGARSENGGENYMDHDGTSIHFYSPIKRRQNLDVGNIDEALIDDEILTDSEFNSKSNLNSRRNTDSKENARGLLRTVYASPHAISTGEFSDPTSRVNSVSKFNNDPHNKTYGSGYDNDSDGVYEYEHGFEYDYEVDGINRSSGHSRKPSNMNSATNHSRKASSNLDGKGIHHYQNRNHLATNHNYIDYTVQNNVSNEKQSNQTENDMDYAKFMKRVRRRHSIPIIEAEMNQYAIEMKSKMDKMDKSASKTSRNMWDCTNPNNYSLESDTNLEDLKDSFNLPDSMPRKKSIFGSQSFNTIGSLDSTYVSMSSIILYSNKVKKTPLRRCRSFGSLEHSLIFDKSSDVYGFEYVDKQFLTPEVLALKYLKLESKYQIDMVQQSYISAKNSKLTSMQLLEQINLDKNPATCVSIRYNTMGIDVNKAVGRYYELEDKLKNTVKSNARLKYELRLLLQKTKEIENNLKTLQNFKIKTLQSKISAIGSSFKVYDKEAEDLKSDSEHCKEAASKEKDVNGDDQCTPIMERLYADDGGIDWKSISWKAIWENPYILVYLFFHLILCTLLHRVDTKMVEQRWREIDKNQTVTMIIRKLYAKSEKEIKRTDSKKKVA